MERGGREQRRREQGKSGREGRVRSSLGRKAGKRDRREIGEEMERNGRNISKRKSNLNDLTKIG